MTKTTAEVIARAHRELGLLAADEAPTADMDAYAQDALDGVIGELAAVQDVSVSASEVPDEVFIPLASLLAAEIAPHYGVQGPSRARAIGRLRAIYLSDDREDRALALFGDDADKADRAAFY